jgi:hypothetical protein
MRIAVLIMVGVFAGVACGYAHTQFELAGVDEQFRTIFIDVSGPEGSDEPAPKIAVVGGENHNFGSMERLGKREHTFVVRNDGDAPLTLEQGETSCKCTISNLEKGQLAPGDEVLIKLEWTAKETETDSKEFSQSAEIISNDPDRRIVRLTITGIIVQTVWSKPPDIRIPSVTRSNGAVAETRIFAYRSDDLEVLEHRLFFTRLEGFINVRFEPLSAEELATEPTARSGRKMILELKPDLPLGDFNEAIRITTNLPDSPKIDIAIQGTVTPDITFLASKEFSRRRRILNLGIVQQEKGSESRLVILAKGPLRDSIEISVKQTEPAGVFEVEVIRDLDSSLNNAVQHEVLIRIPVGVAQQKRLDEDRDGFGKIVLSTNHPDIEELELSVRYAVVESQD